MAISGFADGRRSAMLPGRPIMNAERNCEGLEMNEWEDAEASYRRGYHQGARDAVEAAERLTGNPSVLSGLREWASVTLLAWRLHGLHDRTEKPPVPPTS